MSQPGILQLLSAASKSPQTGSLGQIKQLITNLRSLRDPQSALQQMMQQRSPQLAQAMDYVRNHGNDPKAAFEALAKERGIDPAEIESMLK